MHGKFELVTMATETWKGNCLYYVYICFIIFLRILKEFQHVSKAFFYMIVKILCFIIVLVCCPPSVSTILSVQFFLFQLTDNRPQYAIRMFSKKKNLNVAHAVIWNVYNIFVSIIQY